MTDTPPPRTGGSEIEVLLGLLNHLTYVERWIFLGDNVTDWPSTFAAAMPVTPTSCAS